MAITLPRGPITNGIVAASVLAFLAASVAGPGVPVWGGFIPARVHAFAAHGIALNLDWLPVWITPLSATLIHGGWMHLAFNMLSLIYCGRFVEYVLGGGRLVLLYVLGAYAAAAAQWLAAPGSAVPMVGASGAISAVIGTYAVMFSQREVKAIGPLPARIVRILWMAAAWTVLQLMIGFAGLAGGPLGSVAIWAHVGGFLAGLLLARPLFWWRFGA